MENLFEQLEIPKDDEGTSIKKYEAEFIYNFLHEKGIKNTLEIGFAYGCATAYIISATRNNHYVIDAFQEQIFSNAGLINMERLKLKEFLSFEHDFSHFALPKLVKKGIKVDFAFIDGGHKFDDIFCDFYFIDLLLNSNGYVLFHDAWMRSTQHVVSWIKNNKLNYKIIKVPIKNLILVQKKGEDKRNWYHFNGFYTLKSFYTHWRFKIRSK